MKTINTNWKLIALATIAVLVTIWTGSGMQAKTGQDYTAQSARVSPQIREAAINAFGPIGLTRGQTLRVGLTGPAQNGTEMIVFDCAGNTLIHATVTPGPPGTCSVFDLNADQLPQGGFDNSGRTEMSVRLQSGGDANKSGVSASAQVFDNLTGKTTFALSLQTEAHPGGCN